MNQEEWKIKSHQVWSMYYLRYHKNFRRKISTARNTVIEHRKRRKMGKYQRRKSEKGNQKKKMIKDGDRLRRKKSLGSIFQAVQSKQQNDLDKKPAMWMKETLHPNQATHRTNNYWGNFRESTYRMEYRLIISMVDGSFAWQLKKPSWYKLTLEMPDWYQQSYVLFT